MVKDSSAKERQWNRSKCPIGNNCCHSNRRYSLLISRPRRRFRVFSGDGFAGGCAGGDAADGFAAEYFCGVDWDDSILGRRAFFVEGIFAVCGDVDTVCVYRRDDPTADQYLQGNSRRSFNFGGGKVGVEIYG